MDNMGKINEAVSYVHTNFQKLSNFRGPVLKKAYRQRLQHDKEYKAEATEVVRDYRAVPNVSVYEQLQATRTRKKSLHLSKKRLQKELNSLKTYSLKPKEQVPKDTYLCFDLH